LERVQDMIVLHADRLSESGNASLQVVIKPGAGTQLSLELRQRGDGVEAQAVLQRGDFNHLNQQWPALQQQLEQRGIRLAPLIADGNFASGGENNFQHNQNQSAEPDAFPAGSVRGKLRLAGSFAPSRLSARERIAAGKAGPELNYYANHLNRQRLDRNHVQRHGFRVAADLDAK
jgi:hypothetical protein